MKKLIYKSLSVFLAAAIFISCSDDDKSSTEPNSEMGFDEALIGTWVLTNILSPIATTPEEAGIALVVVFSENGTLVLTTTDAEGTSISPGTWSSSNGEVTITLEGGEPGTSPYSINGNVATISQFPVEFQGTTVLASLEFTKSP